MHLKVFLTTTLAVTASFPSLLFCVCSAPEDVPGADDVRALVKDIWDLRMAKLRKSTDLMVSEQESHALVSGPVCLLRVALHNRSFSYRYTFQIRACVRGASLIVVAKDS